MAIKSDKSIIKSKKWIHIGRFKCEIGKQSFCFELKLQNRGSGKNKGKYVQVDQVISGQPTHFCGFQTANNGLAVFQGLTERLGRGCEEPLAELFAGCGFGLLAKVGIEFFKAKLEHFKEADSNQGKRALTISAIDGTSRKLVSRPRKEGTEIPPGLTFIKLFR